MKHYDGAAQCSALQHRNGDSASTSIATRSGSAAVVEMIHIE